MAEYVNRQDLIKFLDNIQQPKMPITEGFKYITIDEAIKVVSERPIADVVEGFKVDKAIEGIKQDIIAHSGTGEEVIQAYCDGLKKALEYLENIGE